MNNLFILAIVGSILSCGLALIVIPRARRSIASWAFVAGMLVLALESICTGLSDQAVHIDRMMHWQMLRLLALSFLPGTWLLFSLSYARGNAREFLAKWRISLILAAVLPVGTAVVFRDQLISSMRQSRVDDQWQYVLGTPGMILCFFTLFASVLVLMNLERTFRTAVGTMRWRIKFMILGLGVIFAARVYTSSQALLFRAINPSLEVVNLGLLVLGSCLVLRSLIRAGHFEVDLYPSHSILQGSLAALLAGAYLLIVGMFAKLVTYLGGDAAFTFKAFLVLVSLVLLAILLLSDRVRLQSRRFVSRHFQRPLYDYRKVWRSFTEGTVNCVDQTELCRAVIKLTADIFQVLSVTIWLVDEKRGRLQFGASTSLSEAGSANLHLPGIDMTNLIQALHNHPDPVDIDSSTENWAALLRQSHPDIFHKGGHRICVPIMAAGEVLGVILLGDRVGGVQFSLQDFDLLKGIAIQVAANLLNVQLSQKLLQAKELEAFQTMSAFFVHDLKNTASTLNLMLQNLPVHFNDPAFREDALRAVGKTVTHLNNLIGRLGLLRQGVSINRTDVDLNEHIARFLADWEKAAGVNIVKNLQPVARAPVDHEQILKVATNLLLNAKEAMTRQGEISVATRQNNGWIILSVSDTGCGMTPEFINHSLFRPFQTTKTNGTGIGMFQSRMIVEAHGGRIEVESQQDKGTTFHVYLPTQVATK